MIRLEVTYRGIILVGLALLSIWALIELWPVLILILTSVIVMIGLFPYVEAMVARGISRGVSVLILLAIFLAIVVGLFSLVVPAMISEFADIRDNVPESAHEIDRLLAVFDINANLEERARDIDWDEIISGRAAFDYGQRVLTATLSIITVVVMTAYLLIEMPRLARFIYQFIPPEKEEEYDNLFQDITRVVGGYLRGQFITSLTIALYTFVVLSILGIPNATAFAVLAGFADIIPLVGAFIAIIPPVAAALQESYTQALIALALLLAYQQFEDRFFIPRIYGQTLNLPPIIVLIAVLAGAELLGITGVLLALPLTATGRVWLDYILKKRGVSLSPIEPEPEPADETDQILAPDTTAKSPAEAQKTPSLLALAGRRFSRLRNKPSPARQEGQPGNP